MAPPRRVLGITRNRQALIPQRDEPSPFQRDAAAVQRRQDEEAWPWDEINVISEYSIPDPLSPGQNTVQIGFEENNYGTRAVVRPPGYWKLRNGKFILISEMSDTHLTNTIHMVERTAQSRGRRITRTGSYGELVSERERRQNRLGIIEGRMAGVLQTQPPNATPTLSALIGTMATGVEDIMAGVRRAEDLRRPGPDDGELPRGNVPQALGIRYVQDSIEVRVPEPQPSPSAIEENRPTRRIKT